MSIVSVLAKNNNFAFFDLEFGVTCWPQHWNNFLSSLKSIKVSIPELQRFTAVTLSHAVTLPVYSLTLKVCSISAVTWSRSADHGDLVVPRVLSRFGCRSLRVSGPTIWNDLPIDIRSTDITREQFKRSLKSWLFECAYGRRRV